MMMRTTLEKCDAKEINVQKKGRLILYSLVFSMLLLLMPAAAFGTSYHTDIRVLLSIGKNRSFSFTPVGEYYLREDPELKIGEEELEVSVVGSRASLTVGGKTVTAPSLTLVSRDYNGLTSYIRLKHSSYGTCTYLGNMSFDVAGGYIRAINMLPLEYYLYGVVPHEMSNSFPVEALKAQAVCARGYGMSKCSKNATNSYDIRDTSQDQVYRGYASKNHRAIAAVNDTKGQVLTYEGDIIEAYYSASNGGQTERTGNVWENDLPYYVHADDPFDLLNASSLEDLSFIPAVFSDETRAFMDAQVLLALERAAFEAAGGEAELLSTVKVEPCESAYDAPSRCYNAVDITLMVRLQDGREGQLTTRLALDTLDFGSYDDQLGSLSAKKTRLRMRGAEASKRMGLDGTAYEGWDLTVRRYGHGVGLSQRGAQERARGGQAYTEILGFYFVDTGLSTIGSYDTAPRVKSESYRVKSWGVSGIKPGTEVDKLLGRLESEAELQVVTAKGRPKSEGKVGTGNFVRLNYDEGTGYFDLPLVIYGDLNGDGQIDQGDVEALQGHLLRSAVFSGAYLHAADVNHDDTVDALDLWTLIRSVQGESEIRQEG